MAFTDRTRTHLVRLDMATALPALRLVSHVRNAGIPLHITSARRTPARQAELVRAGRSKTLRSKHLTGQAFDIDVLGFARGDVPRWWWYQLGSLAEPLGLRWGGNFRGFWDPGHFEDARAIR